MRKLLILAFFLPLMAWAQSSLPPCPESGLKHNCFGRVVFANGSEYIGEWRGDTRYGHGTFFDAIGGKYVGSWKEDVRHGKGTFVSLGQKYVGEWKDDKRHGQGVEYGEDGSIKRFGTWEQGVLVQSATLDTKPSPFDSQSQVAANESATNPELEAERRKRKQLEAELDAEKKRRIAAENRGKGSSQSNSSGTGFAVARQHQQPVVDAQRCFVYAGQWLFLQIHQRR